MKKILLSSAVAALVSTSVFAGQVELINGPSTIAEELNKIGTSFSIGDKFMNGNPVVAGQPDLAYYTPSQINLVDLDNPVYNIFVADSLNSDTASVGSTITLNTTAGASKGANAQYVIIDDLDASGSITAGDKIIAKATTLTGSKLSFAALTNEKATNSHNYILGTTSSAVVINPASGTLDAGATNNVANFAELLPNDLTITGFNTSSILRVNLGSGDTNQVNDRAAATLFTVEKQMSATITTLDGTIDSTESFAVFKTNGYDINGAELDADKIVVTVNASDLDIEALGLVGDDRVTVKVDFSAALPAGVSAKITNSSGDLDPDSVPVAGMLTSDGTFSVDRKSVTFDVPTGILNQNTAPFTENFTIEFEGNGAELPATNATVTVGYLFNYANVVNDPDYKHYDMTSATEGVDEALKIDTNGEWDYYGYNAVIPYVTTSADAFVKLNNDSAQNAFVYWDLADDKGNVVQKVRVDHMGLENASSTDSLGTLSMYESGVWTATALRTAAQTALTAGGANVVNDVDGEFGVRFRVTNVLVTAPRNLVHGTANFYNVNGSTDMPLLTKEEDNEYLRQ